jgi:hypothetical protein
MLHNPIYAGYYAHGRTRIDPTRPSTGRIVASPDEWLVALPDKLPAYLSVERYKANLARRWPAPRCLCTVAHRHVMLVRWRTWTFGNCVTWWLSRIKVASPVPPTRSP